MSKEKEINVKKKLEGNCLDLSLCDLSTVPVKDIVSGSFSSNIANFRTRI
jgi:hypothetical protein